VHIEYLHASRFGNGAAVAEEFKRHLEAKGITVEVHHVREVDPKTLPPADLYLFSSPGRMGRPIGTMRRFLKRLRLPAGARYALLTTEMAPQPDARTGRLPTEDELGACQQVIPHMNGVLQAAGLVGVAEDKVFVTGMKGPLEPGWEEKVDTFADRLPIAA
jgi:hypothetical protein